MAAFRVVPTCLLLAALVPAGAAVAQDRYVCELGKSQRVIEVVYSSPPSRVPCEVSYTKSSGVQTLWRAESEVGYCETRAREFADKQAGWGWHCAAPAEIDGRPDAADPG